MAKISESTVDALLEKLSSDDDFRDRFQANPRQATRSLGTGDPAVDALPEAPIKQLASKEDFSKSRGKLRTQLAATAYPFQPITLDIPEAQR
ncbi:MAG: NHLP-related RiPP peptide [Rhizobium sp.]|nr:NHLP-related RiPP peptide [Rhizobium sp.]